MNRLIALLMGGLLSGGAAADYLAYSITDTDLEHLKSLEGLKHLDISGTKVTKEGVAALKKALPKCEITSDF